MGFSKFLNTCKGLMNLINKLVTRATQAKVVLNFNTCPDGNS